MAGLRSIRHKWLSWQQVEAFHQTFDWWQGSHEIIFVSIVCSSALGKKQTILSNGGYLKRAIPCYWCQYTAKDEANWATGENPAFSGSISANQMWLKIKLIKTPVTLLSPSFRRHYWLVRARLGPISTEKGRYRFSKVKWQAQNF